jgi:hypothetical protein
MLCKREPRRERTPMPPVSGRSPPTKISTPLERCRLRHPVLKQAKAENAKLQ